MVQLDTCEGATSSSTSLVASRGRVNSVESSGDHEGSSCEK